VRRVSAGGDEVPGHATRRQVIIGTNRRTEHWVDGVTYPIWSNSIGCFDREHIRYDPYVCCPNTLVKTMRF